MKRNDVKKKTKIKKAKLQDNKINNKTQRKNENESEKG